jgi:hypothetical protein
MTDSCRIYNSEAFADLLMSNEAEMSKYGSSKISSKSNKSSKLLSRSKIDSGSTNDPFNNNNRSAVNSIKSVGSSLNSQQQPLQPENPKTLMDRAMEAHKKALKNPHRGRKDKFTASHSKLFEEEQKKQSQTKRRNDERIRRTRQRKEVTFQKNWTGLHAGEGYDLHNEWGKRLSLFDAEKLNRKRTLARQWNEEVYEPIKDRVLKHAELLRERGIHHVRRQEYENFIEAVNLKGGYFLDEVDEAEYDPNVINRMSGTVQIQVNDPTIRTLQRQHEEKIMNPADHHLNLKKTNLPGGLPKCKTKNTLSIKEWGKGKIEATPHGHFAAMHNRDGAPRNIPDLPATRVTLKSGYFDYFNPPKSIALMDEEWANRYGKGKACAARPVDNLKPGQALG